jgi:hypothetical protein
MQLITRNPLENFSTIEVIDAISQSQENTPLAKNNKPDANQFVVATPRTIQPAMSNKNTNHIFYFAPHTPRRLTEELFTMNTIISNKEVSLFTHGSLQDLPRETSTALESEGIMPAATSPVPPCAKPPPRPRVRISKFSQLIIIPYDDAQLKWYTQEERRLFNRTRLHDALRLRNFRNLLPTNARMREDILYECLGLENFLSPHIARRVVQKKRAHTEAVLSAQEIHQGDDMIEKLYETSKKSSQWSRERAAMIAACHASRSGC